MRPPQRAGVVLILDLLLIAELGMVFVCACWRLGEGRVWMDGMHEVI